MRTSRSRKAAREALERARCVVLCGGSGMDTCPVALDAEFEWSWLRVFADATTESIHPLAASALLDGLFVDDLTAVGG